MSRAPIPPTTPELRRAVELLKAACNLHDPWDAAEVKPLLRAFRMHLGTPPLRILDGSEDPRWLKLVARSQDVDRWAQKLGDTRLILNDLCRDYGVRR